MFRKRKKLSAKLKGKPSSMLLKMYGDDFARLMAKNFERITPQDIDAICHACCHYDLRKLTDEEQKKLHLDFGEKDFDLKLSRKAIPVYMPKAELTIRPGYKIMCATVIGKICASDHALNATEEMSALNEGLKKFFEAHHADCPTYRKLEKDAMRFL